MEEINDIKAIWRKEGSRLTRQREVVLGILRRSKNHPTADMIYEEVRKRIPNVSLGTVYRNLKFLHEKNLILKLDFGDGCSCYDGNVQDHYHIHCLKCHRIDDLELSSDENLKTEAAAGSGYKILGYRLGFFGLCPECQDTS